MFPFEIDILKALEGIRSDMLNAIFEGITILGEEVLLIVLMAFLYFMFDKHLARKIFFITAVSVGTNGIIKNFARIPRPFAGGEVSCVRPETATGYSFPSGHTQNFTTWSTAFAAHKKKAWLIVLAVVLSLLIGFSRMYLGAHFPSDVVVGLLLGFSFAFFGNLLYDRATDKNKLHIGALCILTPFMLYFLFIPDMQYADFFKTYGLLFGFTLSIFFEERFVKFDCTSPIWKRLIRVVCGIVVALVIKDGLKMLFDCENLQLMLILSAVRYLVITFSLFALCPWLFKKLHL